MFRSGLSVFLGMVLMMILVMTYQMVLYFTMPDAFPDPEADGAATMSLSFTALLLVLDFATALFAGYFTAAIAGRKEVKHAAALAIVVLALGLLTLVTRFGEEPVVYAVIRTLGVPCLICVGGGIRARQSRPASPIQESAE